MHACAALFADATQRLVCVDLARRDPDPARIAACSPEELGKKLMKCVEGP